MECEKRSKGKRGRCRKSSNIPKETDVDPHLEIAKETTGEVEETSGMPAGPTDSNTDMIAYDENNPANLEGRSDSRMTFVIDEPNEYNDRNATNAVSPTHAQRAGLTNKPRESDTEPLSTKTKKSQTDPFANDDGSEPYILTNEASTCCQESSFTTLIDQPFCYTTRKRRTSAKSKIDPHNSEPAMPSDEMRKREETPRGSRSDEKYSARVAPDETEVTEKKEADFNRRPNPSTVNEVQNGKSEQPTDSANYPANESTAEPEVVEETADETKVETKEETNGGLVEESKKKVMEETTDVTEEERKGELVEESKKEDTEETVEEPKDGVTEAAEETKQEFIDTTEDTKQEDVDESTEDTNKNAVRETLEETRIVPKEKRVSVVSEISDAEESSESSSRRTAFAKGLGRSTSTFLWTNNVVEEQSGSNNYIELSTTSKVTVLFPDGKAKGLTDKEKNNEGHCKAQIKIGCLDESEIAKVVKELVERKCDNICEKKTEEDGAEKDKEKDTEKYEVDEDIKEVQEQAEQVVQEEVKEEVGEEAQEEVKEELREELNDEINEETNEAKVAEKNEKVDKETTETVVEKENEETGDKGGNEKTNENGNKNSKENVEKNGNDNGGENHNENGNTNDVVNRNVNGKENTNENSNEKRGENSNVNGNEKREENSNVNGNEKREENSNVNGNEKREENSNVNGKKKGEETRIANGNNQRNEDGNVKREENLNENGNETRIEDGNEKMKETGEEKGKEIDGEKGEEKDEEKDAENCDELNCNQCSVSTTTSMQMFSSETVTDYCQETTGCQTELLRSLSTFSQKVVDDCTMTDHTVRICRDPLERTEFEDCLFKCSRSPNLSSGYRVVETTCCSTQLAPEYRSARSNINRTNSICQNERSITTQTIRDQLLLNNLINSCNEWATPCVHIVHELPRYSTSPKSCQVNTSCTRDLRRNAALSKFQTDEDDRDFEESLRPKCRLEKSSTFAVMENNYPTHQCGSHSCYTDSNSMNAGVSCCHCEYQNNFWTGNRCACNLRGRMTNRVTVQRNYSFY